MDVNNLFDRQSLYEILYERMPILFFLKRFFNGTPEISSESLLRLEYYKEGKIAAAYVGRREPGNMVEDVNLQSKPIEPPYLKPKSLTSVTSRGQRKMGQNPFNDSTSPQQRKAQETGEKLALLERQIQRAEELQCSDLLQTGEVNARDTENNTLRKVKFDMPASHRVTLTGDDSTGGLPFRWLWTF